MSDKPRSFGLPRPEVSVVIATHNYGRFLPDAIRSVQTQTHTDWECIIVDDASSDDTRDIVADFVRDDPRIRYARNARNLREAGSRNVGNAMARGEYIAILDADDWWHPDKLRIQLESIRRAPGTILCFTAKVEVFDDHEKTIYCEQSLIRDMGRGLRMENFITHSSVLVSREALAAVGGYDEGLPSAPDWDIWLRLMHRFAPAHFVYVDQPLINYRIHGSNISGDLDTMFRRSGSSCGGS